MRLVAFALLLGSALASSATACPRELHCIVTTRVESAALRLSETPAPRRALPKRLVVALHTSEEAELFALQTDLIGFTPAVAYNGDLEMPWIWQVLATEVKNHLPRYDQAENQFSMVLSPVVVTTPAETTPGLGLAGDF